MSDDILWIVVTLSNGLYALPADDVDAMVLLPPTSEVPNTPEHVRGVFILRDKTIPVQDLRVRLGLPSLADETEELLTMLNTREADHVAWLNELEASVAEGRLFKLTTDPHACAFGKWYDAYQTDNLLVANVLKKFDAPHRRIHAIADEVLELEQAGDTEGAKRLIERTKNGDLAEMIRLFGRLREQIKESLREIAVVMTVGDRPYAFAVDAVETVARLSDADGDVKDLGLSKADQGVVTAIRRLDKTGEVVVCLTPTGLLA